MQTMKVAIMTWHHVENYGTALQALALKTTINKLGFDVDFIDCRREYNLAKKHNNLLSVILKIYKFIVKSFYNVFSLSKYYHQFRKNIFEDFYNKYFTYTKPCVYKQDFDDLTEKYDFFVCGSDQIWNSENYDSRFYLDFVKDDKKLIAYAPSLGISQIVNKQVAYDIKKLTKRFKNLSLRENIGCELISKLTGRKDVVNVIDPVFLLSQNEWVYIAAKPTIPIINHYMVIFFLKNNEKYFKYSIKLANKLNLSPIIFHCTQSEDNKYANIDNVSPTEILTIIKNADFICTDSFHITAFSIIFNKQFLSFDKENSKNINRNNRIHELFDRLSIKNHIYAKDVFDIDTIDYSTINKQILKVRKSGIGYLEQSLTNNQALNCYNYCKSCVKEECYNTHIGEYYEAFQNRLKDKGILNQLLLRLMKTQPFTYKEKCYGCKALGEYISKPLFYNELKDKFKNKPLASIFYDYYSYYCFLFIIKNIASKIKKGL